MLTTQYTNMLAMSRVQSVAIRQHFGYPMGMDIEALAYNLRRHRLRRSWTMDRLALEADVDKGTISRLERALQKRPSANVIRLLAATFAISEAQLTEWQPGQGPSTIGPIISSESSGTLASMPLRSVGASAIVSRAAADLWALLMRWGTDMPEIDRFNVTIEGDWLLPAFEDGARIELAQGPGTNGQRVIVMLAERMVTGRIRDDGETRRLDVDGGDTVSMVGLTVLARVVSRMIDEDEPTEEIPE